VQEPNPSGPNIDVFISLNLLIAVLFQFVAWALTIASYDSLDFIDSSFAYMFGGGGAWNTWKTKDRTCPWTTDGGSVWPCTVGDILTALALVNGYCPP